MHDKIFSEQRAMSPAKYLEYAREIGLDMERFSKDLKSDVVQGRINGDKKEAGTLGVTGTPGVSSSMAGSFPGPSRMAISRP